jgi:hypothetical protein
LFLSVCSDAGLRSTELRYTGVAVVSNRLQASNTDTQIKANILEVTVGRGLNRSVSLAVQINEIFPH